ncbi:hypothetical protein DFJ58DRAFT_847554 [Suillus subalutaceus]|uniref:uncharacterized protein n=1 Tax=Suillus subalutaceus TaxID=48586 RepID=UPI001B8817B8|nr:uncharacterized protein DFJ58DRAFT_847554 [Suillus subalutaceus]KAG1834661.1 hypothetical protein DFJ58DRAFT_847554 [Suillus subalutaceus]
MLHSELSTAANKAFSDAADKVEHLLVRARQLQPADQQHLGIAMEMGQALHSEELTKHLDDNETGLISSPVWSNIQVDDPRIKGHLLFTSTLQYQQLASPPSPPTAGPSNSKSHPPTDEPEERGHGVLLLKGLIYDAYIVTTQLYRIRLLASP